MENARPQGVVPWVSWAEVHAVVAALGATVWPQHPGHQRDRCKGYQAPKGGFERLRTAVRSAEVATSTGQNDAGVFLAGGRAAYAHSAT